MQKRFFKYFSLSILAQLIGFGAILICTQLYDPSEFGKYFFLITISTALVPLTTLRLDVDTALTPKSKEFDASWVNPLVLALIIILFTLPSGYFVIVNLFQLKIENDALLISLMFATFIQSLMVLVAGQAMRRDKINELGHSSIWQNLTVGVFQIFAGSRFANFYALLCGFILGRLLGLSYLYAKIRNVFSSPPFSVKGLLQFIEHKRHVVRAGVIDSLIISFPFVISLHLSDFATLGNLGLAHLIVSAPMNLLLGALTTTYLSDPNSVYTKDPYKVSDERFYHVRQIKKLAGLVLAIIITQMIFAIFVMPKIFGNQWTLSANLVILLSVPFALQIIVVPVFISMWKRNEWRLYGNFSFISFLFGVLTFSLSFKVFETSLSLAISAFYLGKSSLTVLLLMLRQVFHKF